MLSRRSLFLELEFFKSKERKKGAHMTTRIVRNAGKLGLATVLLAALAVPACKENQNPEPAPSGDAVASGKAALDEGDWSRAYDSFTTAIAANPNDVDSYYGRAAASLARAKEHYSLAQAAATNGKIEDGRAEAAKADEFFKKATDDADAILKIDAKYAEAWFLKGVACQYQAMWDEGIDAFSECVKLDAERAEAYQRRGEIYDHIGDYMNASVDFKKASELGYSDGPTDAAAALENDVDFSDLNYDPEELEETPSEE